LESPPFSSGKMPNPPYDVVVALSAAFALVAYLAVRGVLDLLGLRPIEE